VPRLSTITNSAEALRDERDVLARGFAAREPWAFDAAYRAYGRFMYGAALQVARDKQLAEDYVHDVLMRLWSRGHTYDPTRGSLAAYLTVCVRTHALSRVRRDVNRQRIEHKLPVYESDETLQNNDPIERARIAGAMAALSAPQRAILDRAYIKDMTLKEIATDLNEPLGTIKSRLSAALRKLREQLEGSEL
jgi:RNA polymerase sigma-70 factor (ECF subfamily)